MNIELKEVICKPNNNQNIEQPKYIMFLKIGSIDKLCFLQGLLVYNSY